MLHEGTQVSPILFISMIPLEKRLFYQSEVVGVLASVGTLICRDHQAG
jgi:hypothetical protein